MALPASVIVLISGRGSNLRALINGQGDYTISAVLSDKEAPGLAFAREAGIAVKSFPRDAYPDKEARQDALFAHLHELRPDFVALAGFMQIIRERHVHSLHGKLLNIHPSLLPKFPGLDTHRRALEANERLHGCTVHFVDPGLDSGPIVAQAQVAVRAGDTEETLAERVLEREHTLYPWVLSAAARGDLTLRGDAVRLSSTALKSARENGFSIISEVL